MLSLKPLTTYILAAFSLRGMRRCCVGIWENANPLGSCAAQIGMSPRDSARQPTYLMDIQAPSLVSRVRRR